MIVDKDPVVARALELLVPPQSGGAEELLARARADAARRHSARRRRRWVAGLAFAALALLTGAAIAASKLNLLPFLQSHDRNTARFSVDQGRTYRGGSPNTLTCASTGTGEFACTRTAATPRIRTYLLVTHAAASPELTRAGMLARLAAADKRGASRALVQRVRADLAGVSDDFIRSLNLIVSIETIAADQSVPGHPGLELVPPAHVPTWVVCAPRSARTFGCRNLAAIASVPVGTPIYRLRPSKDWHTVARPQGQPFEIDRLLDAVLGRQPTEPEIRLLLDVLQAFSTHRSSAGSGTTATTAKRHA
jgi:hypothetical protein